MDFHLSLISHIHYFGLSFPFCLNVTIPLAKEKGKKEERKPDPLFSCVLSIYARGTSELTPFWITQIARFTVKLTS